MQDLIKALTLIDSKTPEDGATHCEHDILYVCGPTIGDFNEKEIALLAEYGFSWDEEFESFTSYRWGSC